MAGRLRQSLAQAGNVSVRHMCGTAMRRVVEIPGSLSGEVALRQIDEPYHPFVGFPGAGVVRKDAVLHQHHSDRPPPATARIKRGAEPRQTETGHDVTHDDDRIAVDVRYALLAVDGVGDR